MLRVSGEAGIACFSVAVRAECARRAVSIVETRCPGSDTQAVFLIDTEAFCVTDPAVTVGPVELEMPESIAS